MSKKVKKVSKKKVPVKKVVSKKKVVKKKVPTKKVRSKVTAKKKVAPRKTMVTVVEKRLDALQETIDRTLDIFDQHMQEVIGRFDKLISVLETDVQSPVPSRGRVSQAFLEDEAHRPSAFMLDDTVKVAGDDRPFQDKRTDP